MIYKSFVLLSCFMIELLISQGSLNTSYIGRWGFGDSSPMFKKDNYGFFFSSGKMCLYDISNLNELQRIGEIDVPISNPLMFDSLIIGTINGGVEIINIHNPKTPIVSTINLSVPPQDYHIKGNLLFLAAQGEGLIIYDISNQNSPVLKTTYKTLDLAFDITVYQQYVFVGNLYSGIQIVNYSNMDSLKTVSIIPLSSIVRMRTIGDNLLIAYKDSLAVYDISSPQNPVSKSIFNIGVIKDFQYHDSKLYTVTKSLCQIYNFPNLSSLNSSGFFKDNSISTIQVFSSFISVSGTNGCSLWDTTNIYQSKYLYNFSRSNNTYNVDISNNIMVVADGSFIQTIDKNTFTQLGQYFNEDPGTVAFDLIVQDTLVYTASATAGLVIYNIANPKNITKLGSFDSPGQARSLFLKGSTCFLADLSAGLRIIDVSNPYLPIEKGFYDTPGAARGVFIINEKAYIADGSSGIQIIDISNNSNPKLLGTYNTPGNAYKVVVNGNNAFVADEGSIRMIDVSNPSLPIEKSFYSKNVPVYSIALSSNKLYAAYGDSGLQIFDITDSLKRIGFSKIYKSENVCFKNDTIYSSTIQGGVWIVHDNTLTSIKDENLSSVDFQLQQNYPNPFNPTTTINYSLPYNGRVTIKIYDMLGREMDTLLDEYKQPGSYKASFDANKFSSGVYYYRLVSGEYSSTKKMLLLK